MKFIINEKEELSMVKERPLIKKLKHLLDSLQPGSLLTRQRISEKLDCDPHNLAPLLVNLDEYRCRDGTRFLYGSRETIEALKEQKNGK